MNITELLVTGYDGSKAIFAINLGPDIINTVLATTNNTGQTEVGPTTDIPTTERAAHVVTAINELLKGMLQLQER